MRYNGQWLKITCAHCKENIYRDRQYKKNAKNQIFFHFHYFLAKAKIQAKRALGNLLAVNFIGLFSDKILGQ